MINNLGTNPQSEKVIQEKFLISRFIDDYFGVIIILLCVCVIAAMSLTLVFPRYLAAKAEYGDIKRSIEMEAGSLQTYRNRLTEYKKSYLSISDIDKEKVKEIIGIPSKHLAIYRADLLVNYDSLLRSNGYEPESIEIEEAKESQANSKAALAAAAQPSELPDDLAALRVRIGLESMNYSKLKELIYLLETELRIADLETVSCSSGLGICEIVFDTYYQIPAEADHAAGA